MTRCIYAIGCPNDAEVETSLGVACCRQCSIQAELADAGKRAKERQAARPGKVAPLDVPEGECGCGCKKKTKGGTFLPGHDAKLKAKQRKEAQKNAPTSK